MAAVWGQQKGEVPNLFACACPCHELPAVDKGTHEDTQGLDSQCGPLQWESQAGAVQHSLTLSSFLCCCGKASNAMQSQ